MNDCYSKVLKELNEKKKLNVDEKNLKMIVDKITNIRDVSGGDAGAFGKNVADFLRRVESAFAAERKNTVLDKIKRDRNRAFLEGYDKKKINQGLRALIRGEAKTREGGNLSAENFQIAAFEMWSSGFERSLTKQGLTEVFASGSLDREISVALFNMKKNGEIDLDSVDLKSIPKEAIDIAKTIRKSQNVMVDDLNRSGAFIEELDGYIQKQVHDGNKILLANQTTWKTDILSFLDTKRSFGDLKPKEIDKVLDDLYYDFTQGHHERADQNSATGVLTRITKGGSLAERVSRQRSLHFKSGDAFFEYNQKYGRQNLAESVTRAFETNSKAYGLLEKFGSNPRAGFDKAINDALDLVKGDPELRKGVAGDWTTATREALWNEISGKTTVYTKNIPSDIAHAATSFTAMSKLGLAAPRSITDLSTATAMLVSNNGDTFLGTIGKVSKNYVSLLPEKNRTFWSRELGFSIETLKNSIINTSGIQGGPGLLSRFNNFYYKMIGLTQHTQAIKLATARILAVDMAENARLGYGSLNDQIKGNLKRYNIGEAEFSVYSSAIKEITEDGSGSKVVTPDSLEQVPDEVFTKAKNMSGNTDPLVKYKRDTIRNYSIYLQDIARHAATEPGVNERSLLNFGFSTSHPIGAALKIITQFKSFPMASLRIMERVGGSKPGGWDAKTVAQHITMSMGLAYMADSLIEASKGKEPKDPMSPNTALEMFKRSGAMGIYADFLLEDYSKSYSSIPKFLTGPTVSTVSDAASLFNKAIRGDASSGESFRFALNNTPFLNTFYLRGALDYLILNDIQENLSPGFMEKQRNRLQKEGRSLLFEE